MLLNKKDLNAISLIINFNGTGIASCWMEFHLEFVGQGWYGAFETLRETIHEAGTGNSE
jgi:hypothetical protein